MLKPYRELVKLDVTPYCDLRKAKDEQNRTIEVPYLNWARCKQLLHENGAEDVWFEPIKDSSGSYLFESKSVSNKDGRTCGCYFVSVRIHIDDIEFTQDSPLLNGSIVVYDDTLNQLRIANAHARAFVKGVAIHTGLGFSLWMKEDMDISEDLSIHSAFAIKKRIEQAITEKMKRGMDWPDILGSIGVSEKWFKNMVRALEESYKFEQRLSQL